MKNSVSLISLVGKRLFATFRRLNGKVYFGCAKNTTGIYWKTGVDGVEYHRFPNYFCFDFHRLLNTISAQNNTQGLAGPTVEFLQSAAFNH